MRLKVPKIARKKLAKVMSEEVSKELGIDTDIVYWNITMDNHGDKYRFILTATVDMDKKDVKRVIKKSIRDTIKR